MDSIPLHPSHLKSSENSLSWTSSRIPVRQSKPIPKPQSKPLQKENLVEPPRRSDSQIRLADLCHEDKAKIGELVKRLALEKSQREETENKFDHDKRVKEKSIRKIARQNEKLLEEKQGLIEKNEKLLELIENYKQNSSGLQSSWRELEKPPSDSQILQLNCSTNILNITPEHHKILSIPISPIKDTNNASVQTLCDKEVQTFEEDIHQRTESNNTLKSDYMSIPKADTGKSLTTSNKDQPRSKAANEIENLRNDIFTLSESVKYINSSSLRASQSLVKRKDLDSYERSNGTMGIDYGKARRLIERSEANNQRGKDLEKEMQNRNIHELDFSSSNSDFRVETEIEKLKGYLTNNKNLKPIMEEKHKVGKELEKKTMNRERAKMVTIDQGFYDDALFQLVDDLENTEEKQDIFDFPSYKRVEKDLELSSSCSSLNYSTKLDNSVDSFQELRIRALRLKQTLKY